MRSRSSSRHNLFAPCSMPRRRKTNCLRRPTKPKSIRSRSLLPYPRSPIPNQSIPQPAARTISPNPSPAFQPSLPLPNRLLLLPFLRRAAAARPCSFRIPALGEYRCIRSWFSHSESNAKTALCQCCNAHGCRVSNETSHLWSGSWTKNFPRCNTHALPLGDTGAPTPRFPGNCLVHVHCAHRSSQGGASSINTRRIRFWLFRSRVTARTTGTTGLDCEFGGSRLQRGWLDQEGKRGESLG